MPGGWVGKAERDFTIISKQQIVAETPRLILRRFEPADAADLFRIYSDSETMRFLGCGPASVEEERSSIENHIRSYYDRSGFGLWGVVLKREGRLIGRCGLLYQDIEGRTDPELAYLLDRDFWGRGFATEAALAVIAIAANIYRLTRMVAVIHPLNTPSINVAERCGFSFEREISGYKDFGDVMLFSRQLDSSV